MAEQFAQLTVEQARILGQMVAWWRQQSPSMLGARGPRGLPVTVDFIARIKDCKRSNGYALCEFAEGDPPTPGVPANADQVYVYLAPQTFVEEGEYIFISRFWSGTTLSWYMTRPVYDPLGPYATPTSGELASSQDAPNDRTTYCDDNVVPPT